MNALSCSFILGDRALESAPFAVFWVQEGATIPFSVFRLLRKPYQTHEIKGSREKMPGNGSV